MPFLLDGNPTQGEISEAINYLLSNFTQNVSADPNTGQIIGPTGGVQAYLYRYIQVKYADSFDGSVGFSNTPTNKGYYGLRNTDSSTESTNPADYIWTQVTGGFGTTKLLYYTVTGGRQISIIAALAAPSPLWQADSGSAIDLDVISGSDGASSRICYAKSTSFALASTPSTYQTTGSATFPPTNTWGGSETWQATPPTLLTNEALFQSDGIYNPMTNLTTWNVPYLSNLKVGALSAITANMGTLTAGEIIVGSSPTISGTSMTGSGTHLYSDGRFVMGNSTTNIVFNGSSAYLNGFNVTASGSVTNVNFLTSTKVALISFTLSKAGIVQFNCGGELTLSSNSATFDSIIIDMSFQLEDSFGSVYKSISCGAQGRTAFISPARYFGESMSASSSISLPTGTFTIYAMKGNLFTADSSGTLSTPTFIAYDLVTAYANYHALFV
jgi:hypothetical protein